MSRRDVALAVITPPFILDVWIFPSLAMLRDLLRSFPLSKLPEIDKLYLGQMRAIISYCRNLNMRVEDQSSLEKVNE